LFVEEDRRCAHDGEPPAHVCGQGGEIPVLADGDTAPLEGAGPKTEGHTLAQVSGHGRGVGVASEPLQRLDGVASAGAVNDQAGVALEVAQGSGGARSEDAVSPSAVESQGAEAALQCGHVVASDHGRSEVEQAGTQVVPGLDHGAPRLATADAVDPKSPPSLECGDRGDGRRSVHAARIVGVVAESRQPHLNVNDGRPRCA
jgi:hypothetical protein